ncbi:hypothetical protein AURDEDRAFT_172550 [Auricularia subglabra TFB-10046 SS5]|nr:hypothetical protein AURDEDRAFT_172550 [Auricularia subglabra TFB-10046 SS5]
MASAQLPDSDIVYAWSSDDYDPAVVDALNPPLPPPVVSVPTANATTTGNAYTTSNNNNELNNYQFSSSIDPAMLPSTSLFPACRLPPPTAPTALAAAVPTLPSPDFSGSAYVVDDPSPVALSNNVNSRPQTPSAADGPPDAAGTLYFSGRKFFLHDSVRDASRLRAIIETAGGIIVKKQYTNYIICRETSSFATYMADKGKKKVIEQAAWVREDWLFSSDKFIASKYPNERRSPLKGCESLIPAMKELIDRTIEHGVKDVTMAKPHRGCLYAPTNVNRKPIDAIMNDFMGSQTDD